MKKIYSSILSLTIIALIASALCVNFAYGHDGAFSDTSRVKQPRQSSGKITDTRKNKPSSLNTKIKLDITPYRPQGTKESSTPVAGIAAAGKTVKPENDKVLTNVKVYPNPVEDELNLSYNIAKDSNVTIKIMDVLGNEVATLFSQKTAAGEKNNTFNIASKLKSGLYFIRLVAGQETIMKRISVQ